MALATLAILASPSLSAASTTPPFTTLLTLGSRGTAVSALQTILKDENFYTYPTITGYFGHLTQAAVKAFQKNNGLEQVGYTGPKTRALLNSINAISANSSTTRLTPTLSLGSSQSVATTSPSSLGIPSLVPGEGGYGGGGGGSASSAATPTRDTTPPTVSITAPVAGTTTAGTITLTATASDNIAVASVQFQVDGSTIGSPLTSSPYTTTWNSKSVADGSHTLSAIATDTSGNSATATMTIAVRNSPPVISSIVTSQISSSTETIAWTTDEAATSQVNYGLSTSYGSASSTPTLATSHSITLTGLTASTTYDFQIQSTDAENNTATSTNQIFTTPAYNYYVDSVHGSDSNAGTSPALAFQNITALPAVTAASTSIGLAAGSYWQNQMITLGTAPNVSISAYGSGARPIIDSSANIPSSSWTADGSGAYCTPPITFAAPSGANNSWINVFESGGPGDNPNGQFLENLSTQAAVDTTPGSYYVSGMSGSGIPTSAAICIHTTDSSNPANNGYVYNYSNQRGGVYLSGGGYLTLNGIEFRKAAGKNGSLDLENDDGAGATVNNVIVRDCPDHCGVLPGGTTITNSYFIDGYYGTLTSTFIVEYEGVASGKPFASNNNVYQQDQEPPGGSTDALLAHSGNLAALGNLTSQGDWFIAKNGADLAGVETQYNALVSLVGDYASNLYKTVLAVTNLSVSNTQSVSSYLYNDFVEVGANNLSVSLSGNQYCETNGVSIDSLSNHTGLAVSISGDTYYRNDKNNSGSFINNNATNASSSLSVNGTTFDSAVQHVAPYTVGSGWTFSGGATGPTANSYRATPLVDTFQFNGSTYTSLANWLAAVSPQDSAATTTRSGASACTLPTIPTVN